MHVSWSQIAMSSSAVQGCLTFTKIEVAHDLSILNKFSVSDLTIEVRECKHMQLMI